MKPDLWPAATRLTLGPLIKLAVEEEWLPVQRPDGDLFASLDGEVGDAVVFLNHVRKMAVHPAASARDEIAPDFNDVAHMQPTFDVFEGIMTAVFGHLRDAVTAS
jgi:hypothetical protein